MWTIKTYYYDHKGGVLRTTAAIDANRAVESALKHMAINHYGAHVASIVDTETGEEHATVKLSPSGVIKVTYIRDARQFERRINLDHWQRELDGK